MIIRYSSQKVVSYLLRHFAVVKPIQVWALVFTYILMAIGFIFRTFLMPSWCTDVLSCGVWNNLDGIVRLRWSLPIIARNIHTMGSLEPWLSQEQYLGYVRWNWQHFHWTFLGLIAERRGLAMGWQSDRRCKSVDKVVRQWLPYNPTALIFGR